MRRHRIHKGVATPARCTFSSSLDSHPHTQDRYLFRSPAPSTASGIMLVRDTFVSLSSFVLACTAAAVDVHSLPRDVAPSSLTGLSACAVSLRVSQEKRERERGTCPDLSNRNHASLPHFLRRIVLQPTRPAYVQVSHTSTQSSRV
jgi:hypothetical protein